MPVEDITMVPEPGEEEVEAVAEEPHVTIPAGEEPLITSPAGEEPLITSPAVEKSSVASSAAEELNVASPGAVKPCVASPAAAEPCVASLASEDLVAGPAADKPQAASQSAEEPHVARPAAVDDAKPLEIEPEDATLVAEVESSAAPTSQLTNVILETALMPDEKKTSPLVSIDTGTFLFRRIQKNHM
jgi:hypothetical protein